jgi:hypothetical protein
MRHCEKREARRSNLSPERGGDCFAFARNDKRLKVTV